jgi:acyl-coenzyme A synthetase/AMP-(fatty) acid ligase
VPALWSAWHQAGALPEQVRLAISAGAPLSAALERAVYERAGLKIHNFYGSSECGGIAYDSANNPRSEDDCAGTPMRKVQVTLNEDGCVLVTSRAVGETYWPDPDGALGGGRFQTSDLAELKDGWVFLRGRLGDQINVAGRKVSPASIELVLAQHSAVKECLVFGLPSDDADRTEVVAACVAAGARVGADELKQFLLSRLPAWQVPRKWWLVDSLSANQRGKLSRAEWRKRFSEDGPGRTS